MPPDIATEAVPPTSNETDVGVATNTSAVGGLVGLSDLLQLTTKNIVLANKTVNAMVKYFFVIIRTSMNDDNWY